MKKFIILSAILTVLVFIACSNMVADESSKVATDKVVANTDKKGLSEEFKKYWYAGEAEITSYQLEQARYGEIRQGKAVLIYVTEDFLPKVQVKADYQNADNIPVLKLNATKKFNTGIYPYSIMQSTFYPVSNDRHAIKVSSSMQEWCGHVYAQLNNREQFEIMSHSYFQGEADQELKVDKAILENELWTQLRIAPDQLPIGKVEIIPSFEYTRLRHKEVKAYAATTSLQKEGDQNVYTITYPKLNRTVSIRFESAFPYEIESWTETFKSGFGPNAKELVTKATKIKSIKSAYWGKNNNKHEVLREELGLQ